MRKFAHTELDKEDTSDVSKLLMHKEDAARMFYDRREWLDKIAARLRAEVVILTGTRLTVIRHLTIILMTSTPEKIM